jgi:hypothetical protein
MSDTKSYAVTNGTERYYDQLRGAYNDIKNGSEASYLLFAFVTLCAATLEYSLNYLMLEYCIDKYGPDEYKRYLNTYTRIAFKEKLYIVPTLLSEGLLVINENHRSVKKLEELIELRNRILHNKESLEPIDTPYIGATIIEDQLVIPVKNSNIEVTIKFKDNPIETLTKLMCLQFGEALGDFKSHIMTPGLHKKLKVSHLLKSRSW